METDLRLCFVINVQSDRNNIRTAELRYVKNGQTGLYTLRNEVTGT